MAPAPYSHSVNVCPLLRKARTYMSWTRAQERDAHGGKDVQHDDFVIMGANNFFVLSGRIRAKQLIQQVTNLYLPFMHARADNHERVVFGNNSQVR